MSTAPHLVIAAGGTGGHMFPAQALAEALLDKGWRVTLSTDARGAHYTSGFPNAVEIRQVSSATFARGGMIAKALTPLRILAGFGTSALRFLVDRPTAVAGFGGYPSIPALGAAWLLRVPRMLHEQNGVLGRVNEVFARRVDKVACGTWPTTLPKGVEGIPCGNPVRAAILERAEAPYPGLDGPLYILVMGGSQGARILSEGVPNAIAMLSTDLRGRLRVSHQARQEDADAVRETYSSAEIDSEVQTFFEDVPERIARSALVISRAGASSVADISVIGRPSILIPFAAAAGDHQTANARGLADIGGALLVPETQLDPGSLCEHIREILTSPEKVDKMRQAALSHAMPDATERLVNLVTDLSRVSPK